MLKYWNVTISTTIGQLPSPYIPGVNLNPLRSRCQHGIRYMEDLLGIMPVRNKREKKQKLGRTFRPQCRSDTCEGDGRKDWVGTFSDYTAQFQKRFGQASWESLSQINCPMSCRNRPIVIPLLCSVISGEKPTGSWALARRWWQSQKGRSWAIC